eukprot:15365465-Ditylum_brightwellii.AAC.2
MRGVFVLLSEDISKIEGPVDTGTVVVEDGNSIVKEGGLEVEGAVEWAGLDALQNQVIPLAVVQVWEGWDG